MTRTEMYQFLVDLYDKIEPPMKYLPLSRQNWLNWIECAKDYEETRKCYRFVTKERPYVLLSLIRQKWKDMPAPAWDFLFRTNKNVPEVRDLIRYLKEFRKEWQNRPLKRRRRV